MVLHYTLKKGILSKEQRLDSSSLSSESYVLALVWPCLDITSLERNVNRIRPIPTQLPPNSSFSPPLLHCRATWSFPCTRHNLWLRFGGWRCVCAALLFQASGAACAAVLRIQEKSVLRGCCFRNLSKSSINLLCLIASQRKTQIRYCQWILFEEGEPGPKRLHNSHH